MKSIKPGRGPSMMNGLGSLLAAGFGLVWTIGAASIGAPGFFLIFGALFILAGLISAGYYLLNATQKNRFSIFDITEDNEEPDPLNARLGTVRYCPQCGARMRDGDLFCAQCGNKLP